jgi:hypothetical protein
MICLPCNRKRWKFPFDAVRNLPLHLKWEFASILLKHIRRIMISAHESLQRNEQKVYLGLNVDFRMYCRWPWSYNRFLERAAVAFTRMVILSTALAPKKSEALGRLFTSTWLCISRRIADFVISWLWMGLVKRPAAAISR